MRTHLAASFAAVLVASLATPAAASTGRPCPTPIGAEKSGRAAVKALGKGLGNSAARAGMSSRRFTDELLRDRTLRVDRCGQALYVEPAAKAAPAPSQALDFSGNALRLNSKPGAKRTIYLDFDGQLISGTAWNQTWRGGGSWTAPAYSIDRKSSFSSAELQEIANVWLRVAEDYAPFDVNVTTADPGLAALERSSTADEVYGTRVVITTDSVGYNACSCGGVAYVGVFDRAGEHSYYQPAWVFTKGVGTGSKNIAEAASHEAGHTLGLSHDGQTNVGYYAGHGGWAPIMGVGYYKPVSQWSRGEYALANQTQDDFAVMASHGLAPVGDDHGGSAATATALSGSESGIIANSEDTDWFLFTARGSTTVTVSPQSVGANLDAGLSVYRADGTLVASADPASGMVSASIAFGLDASVSADLPEGTYYAKVDGVGFGDPLSTGYSDYGSVGRYDITVTGTSSLAVSTSSLPDARLRTSYSATLAASGGSGSLTWSVSGGKLPGGISLASTGRLSGKPSKTGTYSFTARVSDGSGASATRTLTIVVRR